MRSATRGMLFHQNNSPADTSSHTMADIGNAWYELLHHPSPLTARSGTTWLLCVCFQSWKNTQENAQFLTMRTSYAQQIAAWAGRTALQRHAGPSTYQLQPSRLCWIYELFWIPV